MTTWMKKVRVELVSSKVRDSKEMRSVWVLLAAIEEGQMRLPDTSHDQGAAALFPDREFGGGWHDVLDGAAPLVRAASGAAPAHVGHDVAQDAKQHIGVQGPLVRLVHDDRRVVVQVGLAEGLPQQDPVRHVPETSDASGEPHAWRSACPASQRKPT